MEETDLIKNEFINYVLNHCINLNLKENEFKQSLIKALNGIEPSILYLILIIFRNNNISFKNEKLYSYSSTIKLICLNLNNIDSYSLMHELGHLIDDASNWQFKRNLFSNINNYEWRFSLSLILHSGKTLSETIKEEMKAKKQEIYDYIISKFKKEVFPKIGVKNGNKFFEYNRLYSEYQSLSHKFPLKKSSALGGEIQYEDVNDELSSINWKRCFSNKDEAIEAYNRYTELSRFFGTYDEFKKINNVVTQNEAYITFCNKYSAVLDILNYYFDTNLICDTHSKTYLKRRGNLAIEFFAILFSQLAINSEESLKAVLQLMPKSFQGFREIIIFMKNNI